MLRIHNLLALLLALVAAWSPRAAAAAGVVSTDWVSEHLEDPDLALLHVGQRQEYDEAHLPGARHVLLDDISTPHDMSQLMLELPAAETLRRNLEALGLSSSSRIVVYFGTDWVTPATRLLFTLDVVGLGDRSSLLDGGMPAWIRDGHAVTDEPTASRRGSLAPFAYRPLVVDADFVREHLGRPGFRVIDGRNAAFYDGIETGGGHAGPHRRGHIDGAGSLPFTDIVDEDLELRTDDELAELFARAGAKPGDTIIAYCHIGQQATAVLFAANRLGYPVRLYDGSFEDWSQRGDGYPVVDPSAGGRP